MATTSVNDIMTSMQTVVTNLGLTLDTVTLPVNIRKLPKKAESVDPSRQIIISKNQRPERIKPFAYAPTTGQSLYRTQFYVDVTLIAPNGGDQLTDLSNYASIRRSIEGAFRTPFSSPLLPNLNSVIDLDVMQGEFEEPEKLTEFYDYLQTTVMVTVVE